MALVDEAVVPALNEAVAELRHYNTDSGLPFRSAKLPSLRLCLHTGFDKEAAILNFRSVLLYAPPVSPLDGVNGQVWDFNLHMIAFELWDNAGVVGGREAKLERVGGIIGQEYLGVIRP